MDLLSAGVRIDVIDTTDNMPVSLKPPMGDVGMNIPFTPRGKYRITASASMLADVDALVVEADAERLVMIDRGETKELAVVEAEAPLSIRLESGNRLSIEARVREATNDIRARVQQALSDQPTSPPWRAASFPQPRFPIASAAAIFPQPRFAVATSFPPMARPHARPLMQEVLSRTSFVVGWVPA
jgi:hypothetical protein